MIVAALLRMLYTNQHHINTKLLIIQLVKKSADIRQNHCDTYVCRKRPYLVVAQEKNFILISKMTETGIGV